MSDCKAECNVQMFFRQYKQLVWKNFLLKRRRLATLISEILNPCVCLIVLILLRQNSPRDAMPSCHLRAQNLPSMGSANYFTSFMCNWRSSCFNSSQSTYNEDYNMFTDPDLMHFLNEFGKVIYNDKLSKPIMNYKLKYLISDRQLLSKRTNELSNATKDVLFESKIKNPDILLYLLNPDCNAKRIDTFLELPPGSNLEQLTRDLCGLSYIDRLLIFQRFLRDLNILSKLDYLVKTASLQSSVINFLPKFKRAMTLLRNLSLPLNDKTLTGYLNLSAGLCGTNTGNENDLGFLIDLLNTYLHDPEIRRQFSEQFKPKTNKSIDFPNPYCSAIEKFQLVPKIGPFWQRIHSYLFGQIIVYPDNNVTRSIMKVLGDESRKLIDLKKWLIKWNNEDQYVVKRELVDSPWIYVLRQSLEKCSLEEGELGKFCKELGEMIAVKPVKGTELGHISQYLEVFTAVSKELVKVLSCIHEERFKFFNDSKGFENYLSREGNNMSLTGGIYFSNTGAGSKSDITYLNLRMKLGQIDDTTRFKVLDKWWQPKPRANIDKDLKYSSSGFIDMQDKLERVILKNKLKETNASSSIIDDIGVKTVLFPTPCYMEDGMTNTVLTQVPFLMIISWIASIMTLVRNVVYEKEKKLKEFSKVIGINNLNNWLAWFTITIWCSLISSLVISLVLKYCKIMVLSDVTVIFFYSACFNVLVICEGFFFSTLFEKANPASASTVFFYFILYLPFIATESNRERLTFGILTTLCLFPQTACGLGWKRIGQLEVQGVGAQWSTLWGRDHLNGSFSLGTCIQMMFVDCILFLLLTWYIEAVFPGKNGIPKPFYFMFQKSYWIGNVVEYESKEYLLDGDTNTKISANFEPDPIEFDVGVSVKSLSKQYSQSVPPALSHITINFYENQVTSFLGHNGAGKTTMMSILTGMFPPSSGQVHILNKSILTDINAVRKVIGYCPQHNILFGDLTVHEHLTFTANCKSALSKQSIEQEIRQLLSELSIEEKIHEKTKALSGGQKRKLCIAMAFIGDAKVIFLDEPTAGVDPYSRRAIWDLILNNKANRSIILTTHHMNEADILSDRIAVLNKGKLKAIGSSVFLKSRFSNGLRLILERKFLVSDSKDSFKEVTNLKALMSVIQEHCRKAELLEVTRSKIEILLPSENGDLHQEVIALFSELEKRKLTLLRENLGITNFSVSDSTLEEIFLKLTGNICEELNYASVLPEIESICSEDQVTPIQMNKSQPNYRLKYSRLKGWRYFIRQFYAIFYKRFHHIRKCYSDILIEFVFPIFIVFLCLLIIYFTSSIPVNPPMPLHPWLMMNKTESRSLKLFTKMSAPPTNDILDEVYLSSKEPYGLTGTRCFPTSTTKFIHRDILCQHKNKKKAWMPSTYIERRELNLIHKNEQTNCSCEATGFMQCPQLTYTLPSRILPSSDTLYDMSKVDLPDYLLKTRTENIGSLYGGIEFNKTDNYILVKSVKSILQPSALGLRLDRMFNVTNVFGKLINAYLSNLPPVNNVKIWFNNKGYVSSVAYVNTYTNLLFRIMSKTLGTGAATPNTGIVTMSHPFTAFTLKTTYSEEELASVAGTAYGLIIAFSILPASFVFFLVAERSNGAKHLQFLSGLHRQIYWFSNFCWDAISYLFVMCSILGVIFAFQREEFISEVTLTYFISLLLNYGLSIITFTYLITFLFKVPSKAFIYAVIFNVFVGLISTIIVILLEQEARANNLPEMAYNICWFIMLVLPQFCFGYSLFKLAMLYKITTSLQSFIDAGITHPLMDQIRIPTIKYELCALAVQAIFNVGMIMSIEYNLFQQMIYLKKVPKEASEPLYTSADHEGKLDNDVQAEERNVIKVSPFYNPFKYVSMPD